MSTTNEAAERLYVLLAEFIRDERTAERRATVERIRERLAEAMQPYGEIDDMFRDEILALVEEAAK